MPRDYVTRKMLSYFVMTVNFLSVWQDTARCLVPARVGYDLLPAELLWVGQFWIAKLFMFTTSQRKLALNFRIPRLFTKLLVHVVWLLRRSCAKETLLELLPFVAKRFVLSPTSKSHSLKRLLIRQSSQSRTSGSSKRSRSATRNCESRWSIRRQRPRCSVSSAGRRRTCSRCSTRSLRAQPGFVESMTWG